MSDTLVLPSFLCNRDASLSSALDGTLALSFAYVALKTSPRECNDHLPPYLWLVVNWATWFPSGDNRLDGKVGDLLAFDGREFLEGTIQTENFIDEDSLNNMDIRLRILSILSQSSTEAREATIKQAVSHTLRTPMISTKQVVKGSIRKSKGLGQLSRQKRQQQSQTITESLDSSSGNIVEGFSPSKVTLSQFGTLGTICKRQSSDGKIPIDQAESSIFLCSPKEYDPSIAWELGIQLPSETSILLDHVVLKRLDIKIGIQKCFSYGYSGQQRNQKALTQLNYFLNLTDQLMKEIKIELKEVVQEKEKAEESLLTSFATLLNEKKKKCRELEAENQRLRHRLGISYDEDILPPLPNKNSSMPSSSEQSH